MESWTHTCNAYCHAGEHCDLFHADAKADEWTLKQGLGYYAGLKVTRAERAKESGPLTGSEPAIMGDAAKATVPWLVWWEV